MKRLLALIFALCVFCVCAASAETVTSDGTMVVLDDFTLLMQPGMVYAQSEKAVNAILIQFQPYAGSGDTASNMNFVWAGGSFNVSVESENAERELRGKNMTDALNNLGYSVGGIEYGDAFDCTIGGEPGVGLDARITISYQSVTLVIYQRQISIGTKGYVISISGADPEALDKMTEMLDYMTIWN